MINKSLDQPNENISVTKVNYAAKNDFTERFSPATLLFIREPIGIWLTEGLKLHAIPFIVFRHISRLIG